MEALFFGLMLLWLLRQGTQFFVQRAIQHDHLEAALGWARAHTLLGPTRYSLVQWGNLLGDLQHWQRARQKFRWAHSLGYCPGALLGLGTAELALAKIPEDSESAHAYFTALHPTLHLPPCDLGPEAPHLLQAQALTDQYHEQGWILLDDFLSPAAVQALHQWCQHTGLWRHHYRGYDGAHLDDGLSHPVIYRLAQRLIKTLPGIFEQHLLMYAWAFRYHHNHEGVALHHDSAHINVNLWLTPEACNLNPQTGGLTLYPKSPPSAWDLERYTLSSEQMKQWVSDAKIQPVTIPYRQGRIALFNSRFLHQTQDFQFATEPSQQRLNLTLLFGQHPLRYHPRHTLPERHFQRGLKF